jgi:TonB-dependent receptor
MKPLKKAVRCLVVFLFVSLAHVAPGFGQAATGSLSGTVADQQGGVLPGATVVVAHQATGARFEAVTREDGRYTVSNLPAGGPYLVTVTIGGFQVQEKGDVSVASGEEQQVDFRLLLDAIAENVTVMAGMALARQQKRGARNILDSVSADAMGRFPDDNAAEALRRTPGVSMEIDQGEGRFVVVRGVDASLNNVTINGQIVGTPAEFGTRGVSMDSVPADLISRLEVVKAVRPDMDANAIGASIDIATRNAFDRPEGFFSGSVRTGYNEMSGRVPYSGNVTFGRVLDDAQRWGIVAGGSYSHRRYDSELVNGSSDTWTSFNGLFVPHDHTRYLYDVERQRQGVNAALEFRPARGHDLALRFNHNLFQDLEGRQQSSFDFTRGTLTNQTPTSGSFSQGQATRQFRDYEQEHLINALQLGGDHTMRRYIVDWKLGASRGQRRTPNRVDWEFRSAANAFPNSYDISDPTLPVITPSDNFYSASAYPFRRVRFRNDLEREDVLTGEINLKRNTTLAERAAYWKAGAKIVARDKTQNRENLNYTGSGFTLADFGLGGPEPGSFFDGQYRFGPTLNLPVLKEFFTENPDRFAFDARTSLQNSLEQDFDATENVYAGYLMTGVDFARWNFLAGVRVERTDGSYAANELLFTAGTFNSNFNRVSGDTNYTNVLPGVHVNFYPSKQLTIRAAWTNTLGRPSYQNLAPTRAFDEILNENGTYTGSLVSGNPELDPYESMNVDLSVEYYLPSGIISVAPFYKRIENPIFTRATVQDNVTIDGRFYERLSTSQPENAERGHVAGVELNYQNFFTFLPSPLDGFGVNLNYTFGDSSVTVFGRDDDLPFFKQSDRVGNAALIYEKYGVTGQIAVSYTSPNLGSLAGVGFDNYADSYTTLDAKLSVPLSRRLRGFVDLRNLNDEARLRYSGAPERRTSYEIYSWNVNAGFDWRF